MVAGGGGQLTRAEVAAALELPPQHTAVRVQRMKAHWSETPARLVVRALSAQPRCVLLDDITEAWDGVPSALWRKRIARHARDCTVCAGFQSGLVPAEGLLVGLGLVPVAAGLLTALGAGTAEAAPMSFAGRATAEPGDTATASYGETPTEPYGETGGPVPAGSPAENLGTVEVGRRRANRSAGDRTRGRTNGPAGSRAQNRARRRRSRNIAAVAAALLVTGGAISGWALLTPDGEADKVQSASAGRPGSTASEPASPSPSSSSASAAASASASSSPSLSPSASASPDASRKPKSSATPSSEATRTKSAAAPVQPEKTSARPEPAPSTAPAAAPGGARAAQVLALTNTERAAAGCSPVTLDNRLNKAAQTAQRGHVRQQLLLAHRAERQQFRRPRHGAGSPSPGAENIARGQAPAESVMEAWMNSEGHRANILNCSLTTMGVGVVTSDWTWTQVFGR
ncbi:sigma-70 family RNA polymerase sigma factor [Streptomyces hirsutus]